MFAHSCCVNFVEKFLYECLFFTGGSVPPSLQFQFVESNMCEYFFREKKKGNRRKFCSVLV